MATQPSAIVQIAKITDDLYAIHLLPTELRKEKVRIPLSVQELALLFDTLALVMEQLEREGQIPANEMPLSHEQVEDMIEEEYEREYRDAEERG